MSDNKRHQHCHGSPMDHLRKPEDETLRLASLQALGILDSAPDRSFDAVVETVAQLTACPMAAISLIDAHRQWLKAVHGMPNHTVPRDQSFCAHAILQSDLLEVQDARDDPRFRNHPGVVNAPHLRMYAGAPLCVDGMMVGTLFVVDTVSRALTPEQRDGLRRMAEVTVGLIHGSQRLNSLETERARLLDFARASGDWMWETDAQLRYTWVSETFEAVTGIPQREIIGTTISDAPLLNEQGEPREPAQSLHGLLAEHRHFTRVITDKRGVHGGLQISRSAVPVFDARQGFAGFRGTARDVSKRITAERNVHLQAERLRKLSSQVPGAIFQFHFKPDHSIEYLYASDACRDMFGAEPPHGGNGGDPEAVCQALHPDDAADTLKSLALASRQMSAWSTEYRTVLNGRQRWLEVRAMPEPHPDGGVIWHGFTADVTARKEIELALLTGERRWNMAAQVAGIGIAQFDLSTGTITMDAVACANHGLPHAHAESSIEQWMEPVDEADRAGLMSAMQEALSHKSTVEMRYRIDMADGSKRTLEIFAHCTQASDGSATGLLGTCRDVTHQVVHEQLRRDKETAERASHAKSEFLSRVSHELRTPLNGILGFAQLMALDRVNPLASDQSRRLDSVLHAGRHLLDLINDVLDLARIEQSEFQLKRMPVNLHASIEACVSLIRPLADSAGVHLVLPTRTAPWALGDVRGVEQVLINLLSNAIKYNRPHGTVRIALAQDHRGVHIQVTDEGEGLSTEQQAHLFEPFNRLGAEQRRVEGTGLGLVIARALSRAMGGHLGVVSAPRAGSTFTLTLPQAQTPSPTLGVSTAPEAARPHGAQAPRQVLYIEDEAMNQLLMRELFHSQPQWTLSIEADGHAGLKALERLRPDLVLIDMNLPDMSGLTLIRQLRESPHSHDLHCIALSAGAMQSQIDSALAAGFNAYWTKPIHVPTVLSTLGALLSEPH